MTAASPVPGGQEIAPDFLDRDLAADLTATALAMARRFASGATMWCVAGRVGRSGLANGLTNPSLQANDRSGTTSFLKMVSLPIALGTPNAALSRSLSSGKLCCSMR